MLWQHTLHGHIHRTRTAAWPASHIQALSCAVQLMLLLLLCVCVCVFSYIQGKRVSASARGAHNGSSPLQDITDQSDDDLAGVLPDASGDLSDDDESASTSSSDTEGGSVRDNSLPSGKGGVNAFVCVCVQCVCVCERERAG